LPEGGTEAILPIIKTSSKISRFDFVGSVPRRQILLALVNYTTGYPEAVLLTAKQMADALFLLSVGIPKQIKGYYPLPEWALSNRSYNR
jgi:hypothetical protein